MVQCSAVNITNCWLVCPPIPLMSLIRIVMLIHTRAHTHAHTHTHTHTRAHTHTNHTRLKDMHGAATTQMQQKQAKHS